MVIHAFPAAKLATLLIKQISKPIANAVKQGAKSSPVFRKYVCLPPAQFYNWCEVKSKMWLLHLGQPVKITVLNEAASIELGANLLGETVIFAIAAALLVFEYNRSSKKEAAKEEARLAEIQDLKDALRDLFIQTEEQNAHIRELTRKLADLETPSIKKSHDRKSNYSRTEPPPPPSSGSLRKILQTERTSQKEDNLQDVDLLENCKYKPLKGVVFRAVAHLEDNMFFDPYRKREPGVLTIALNFLYKDVYKSKMSFE